MFLLDYNYNAIDTLNNTPNLCNGITKFKVSQTPSPVTSKSINQSSVVQILLFRFTRKQPNNLRTHRTFELLQPPFILPLLRDNPSNFRYRVHHPIIINNIQPTHRIPCMCKRRFKEHGVRNDLRTQSATLPTCNSPRDTELSFNCTSRSRNCQNIPSHSCQIRIHPLIDLPPLQRR